MPSLVDDDIGDFAYMENARRITNVIRDQFNTSNFPFTGVSVSGPLIMIMIITLVEFDNFNLSLKFNTNFLQGRVAFNQNGTRDPATAKVFKYFGGNSTCGSTAGTHVVMLKCLTT